MITISDKTEFVKVHEISCKCTNWADNTFFKNKEYKVCEEMVCPICKSRYVWELSEEHEYFQGEVREELWLKYIDSHTSKDTQNERISIKSKVPEFTIRKSNGNFWMAVDGYGDTEQKSKNELIDKLNEWLAYHSN
ncbi:hypothetical protein D5R95_00675 [Methanosalsum natronophilum]|uniref:Uncharacterized protein n=1 Tax=Methanosalsum natronophilum TaxID=768733 RepID=A0A424Z4C6_9EURY|nr:MAG: hypothetical protein D5R95_00675 [Methanosalsum natronophilum]